MELIEKINFIQSNSSFIKLPTNNNLVAEIYANLQLIILQHSTQIKSEYIYNITPKHNFQNNSLIQNLELLNKFLNSNYITGLQFSFIMEYQKTFTYKGNIQSKYSFDGKKLTFNSYPVSSAANRYTLIHNKERVTKELITILSNVCYNESYKLTDNLLSHIGNKLPLENVTVINQVGSIKLKFKNINSYTEFYNNYKLITTYLQGYNYEN